MNTSWQREVLVHIADTGVDGCPPPPLAARLQAAVPEVSGAGVTPVASPSRRQSPVPGGAQGTCELRSGDTNPSAWPVLALELLLRELNIGDLMACSQVCRHWRQVTMDRRLLQRGLLQTWPVAHRHQLESALDTGLVRASLAPWCDRPARSVRGASAQAAPDPSPQELLFTAVQRMLLTDRFHPGNFQVSTGITGRIQAFVSSLDGRFMAAAVQRATRTRTWYSLSLWNFGGGAVLRSSGGDSGFQEGAVEQLAWGSAPRSFRTLLRTGCVGGWRQESPGHFPLSMSGSGRIFENDVAHQTVLSADGKYLAIGYRRRVAIYGEDAGSGWAVRPEWSQSLSRNARASHCDPAHVAMRFSDDSRHFVFGGEHRAFVCTQDAGGQWQRQELFLRGTVRGQPVLDARSRMLALAYGSDDDKGWSADGGICFWRFDEPPHSPDQARWKPVMCPGRDYPLTLSIRIHPGTGYRVPMAFSPDCQLVAVPDRRDCRRLRIIPISGPEAWAVEFRLGAEEEPGERGLYEPVSFVQFSANSCYLAVHAGWSLMLWRRSLNCWNQTLRLADPLRHAQVPFAFSPDGFHCVTSTLSRNLQEQICVWGPVSGGQYRCKYQALEGVPLGFRTEKVQFMAAGTRVLAVGYGWEFGKNRGAGDDRSGDARIVSRFFCWDLVPHESSASGV